MCANAEETELIMQTLRRVLQAERDWSHWNLESVFFGLRSGGWVELEVGQMDRMENILQVNKDDNVMGKKQSK